jgi:hypothetical protein
VLEGDFPRLLIFIFTRLSGALRWIAPLASMEKIIPKVRRVLMPSSEGRHCDFKLELNHEFPYF